MSQDVKPTRAEELRLKERIELAESGHSILEKKRDSLIHDFMEMADEAKDVKTGLADAFEQAEEEISKAVAFEGANTVRSIAMAVDQSPQVELTSRNIMGVQVPDIASENVRRQMDERGFSIYSSTSRIDKAAEAYEKLLEQVIQYAETETALIKLLDEIDKTKRRVNALEEKVIPELKDSLSYISQTLEESEREETFRLKKIKEKTEQQQGPDEEDDGTVECPVCGDSFDSERGMHIHRSQVHDS